MVMSITVSSNPTVITCDQLKLNDKALCLVLGATRSGKSTQIVNLLENYKHFLKFEPERIVWVGQYFEKDLFADRKELQRLVRHIGLPQEKVNLATHVDQALVDLAEDRSCVFVIDDLQPELESTFGNIALGSRIASHRRALGFITLQAIYSGRFRA